MTAVNALPMKAAQEFWAGKIQLSPGVFSKLSDEARLKAFAISGIAKGDELSTVFNALQSALDDGITFDQFKQRTAETFERRGWTGARAWRVDNIFRTNIQTAYNVGRYQQMSRVASRRPYWMYDAVNDSRTRLHHRAMDGKVFPADHPFWDKWYPPNGFRCRCGVQSLSERQVKARGLKVETVDPTDRLFEPVDPLTGVKYPARLLRPDLGFDHHPGKAVFGGLIEAGLSGGKWVDLQRLKGPSGYRRAKLENVTPAKIGNFDASKLLPRHQSDEVYKSAFKDLYGETKVLRDPVGEPVILSLRSFLVDKTPGVAPKWKFDKGGHGEIIPLLGEMIENPYEIWLTPQRGEDGKIRLTKRYISLWKTSDKQRIGGLAVFEVVDGVMQGVTAFKPLRKGKPDLRYLEAQRTGHLLYGKGR